MFEKIKGKIINNWQQVHDYYDYCEENYLFYKVNYAVYLLERLYSKKIRDFEDSIFEDIIRDVTAVSLEMLGEARSSRQKDYVDGFRKITFRNEEEMAAVLGKIDDNEFLAEMKPKTEAFNEALHSLFNV